MLERRVRHLKVLKTAQELIRKETLNGVDHTVIPIVALVEGPIQGANAAQPELVTKEEFAKQVATWNGRPVTMGHPMRHGEFISAGDPEVMETDVMGIIFNTKLEDDKLKMEAWISSELIENVGDEAKAVLARIEVGEEVEISTGYFSDISPQGGIFDNEPYKGIQKNIVPDHLAILAEGEIGACSWEDGCGAARVNCQCGEAHVDTDKFLEIQAQFYKMRSIPLLVPEGSSLRQAETFGTAPLSVQQYVVQNLNGPTYGPIATIFNALKEKFFTGAGDGLSDGDRRNALQSAVEGEDSNVYPWVMAVFEDTFVYEVNFSDLVSRSFAIGTDGVVTLGEEKEVVRPVTQFVPVVVNQEEQDMSKKEIVDGLIANTATQFAETDREWLTSLSDEHLGKLAPNEDPPAEDDGATPANEPVATENSDAAPVSDPPVEDKAGDVDPPAGATADGGTIPVANTPSRTAEQYVNAAPKEIQEVLRQGLTLNAERRKGLTELITANTANTFTKEQLAGMETTQLESIAKLANQESYEGLGAAELQVNLAGQDNGVPEPPSIVAAIQARKKAAAA